MTRLTPAQVKMQFLSIIEERLIELDTEYENFKNHPHVKTVLVQRRMAWNRHTKETNLKWKSVLTLGRFATIDELKAATR
jgi:hypothetical protein